MPVIRSLVIAFSTYSRIPMPQVEWTEENRRYSLCYFPLIGLAVGLAVWGWLTLCEALKIGPFLRGVVAALMPLFLTGGIHMDGFMDTTDALASWQPKEKRLEILKDSHVGAFAVMACTGYLLLSSALLSEVALKQAPSLIGVYVLSRALSAFSVVQLKSAKLQGMLNDVSHASPNQPILLSGGIYTLLCMLFWGLTGGWMLCVVCLLTSALCFFAYQRMACRQFGGVTGDLAGWFLQVTELALIAVIVTGGKLG